MFKISTELLTDYIGNPKATDAAVRKAAGIPHDRYYSVELYPVPGLIRIERHREAPRPKISKSDATP